MVSLCLTVSIDCILNKISDIGLGFSLQGIYLLFSWICHKQAQGSNDLERLLNWHPLVIRLVHVYEYILINQ
jgi:hypothetical protein